MNGTIVNFGPLEILFILILALLVLGPERLPKLARGIGKTLRRIRELYVSFVTEFRNELQPIAEEVDKVTSEISGELQAIREATDFRNILQPVADDISKATDINTPLNELQREVNAPAWGFDTQKNTNGAASAALPAPEQAPGAAVTADGTTTASEAASSDAANAVDLTPALSDGAAQIEPTAADAALDAPAPVAEASPRTLDEMLAAYRNPSEMKAITTETEVIFPPSFVPSSVETADAADALPMSEEAIAALEAEAAADTDAFPGVIESEPLVIEPDDAAADEPAPTAASTTNSHVVRDVPPAGAFDLASAAPGAHAQAAFSIGRLNLDLTLDNPWGLLEAPIRSDQLDEDSPWRA
jgi:sec-independent protein translocase protein TatB